MRRHNIYDGITRYSIIIEAVTAVITVSFLIYTLRPLLIYGETTFVHDNITWGYTTYQFFAESITNGHYPFWNPFTHSGEPFYPVILQRLFLDPLVLMVIYTGKFVTDDIVMWFNWNLFIHSLVMTGGVYIVFRPLARHLFIRLTLMPILLYSSIMINSFRQSGVLDMFIWIPYITYFMLRIVYYKDYRWHNWLAFAAFIGLNCQSYFFSGTWTILLFFLFGFALFRRDLLRDLFMSRRIMVKISVAAVIILAMMVPNIILLLEKNDYVYPLRMMKTSYIRLLKLDDNIQSEHEPLPEAMPMLGSGETGYEGDVSNIVPAVFAPYNVMAFTGAFSRIWTYIQIISPDGNLSPGWPDRELWGFPSDAYMYIGILPWAIAFLGMVTGRHDLKKVWLLVLICLGLLMQGPPGGLYRLLYCFFPPLWFLRGVTYFIIFFAFSFLYFYVLGFNHIFSTWGGRLFPRNITDSNPDHLLTGASVGSEGVKSNFLTRTAGKFRRHRFINFIDYSVIRRIRYFMVRYPSDMSYLGNVLSTLIFSACIVASVYGMTKLEYPAVNYQFGYIILIMTTGWLLRKELGGKGLFVSIIISHIVIVLIFNPNAYEFLSHIAVVLGVPVLLYLILKMYVVKTQRNLATIIMLAVFAVFLCGELIYSLKQSSYLYRGQKHPGTAYGVDTTYQRPSLPESRFVSPPPLLSSTTQTLRFLPLVYRQPFVFTPVLDYKYSHKSDDKFEDVLINKRCSSFFLPKKYFNLINSGIPPMAMKEMFAVDKPPFQFRKGAVIADDGESYECLKQMGPEGSVQFLKDYVFIDRHSDHSLIGTGIPAEGYAQVDQVAFAAGSYKDGEDKGQDVTFLYTISERYAHNSFDMEVSTDEEGILYWADGYDKWWRAYINGIEVPLYRANVNFKAVALPEGMSIVKFVYSPTLFKLALSLFYGVFTISMAAALGIFSGAERYRIQGS